MIDKFDTEINVHFLSIVETATNGGKIGWPQKCLS